MPFEDSVYVVVFSRAAGGGDTVEVIVPEVVTLGVIVCPAPVLSTVTHGLGAAPRTRRGILANAAWADSRTAVSTAKDRRLDGVGILAMFA
jgi:hypothetical protein